MSAGRHVALTIWVLVVLAGPLLAQSPAPAGPDSLAPAIAGTLRLHNDSLPLVTVQLRVDTGRGCDEGTALASPPVAPGRSITLTTSQTLCWRREAHPGSPDGAWTVWRRVVPEAAGTEIVL